MLPSIERRRVLPCDVCWSCGADGIRSVTLTPPTNAAVWLTFRVSTAEAKRLFRPNGDRGFVVKTRRTCFCQISSRCSTRKTVGWAINRHCHRKTSFTSCAFFCKGVGWKVLYTEVAHLEDVLRIRDGG